MNAAIFRIQKICLLKKNFGRLRNLFRSKNFSADFFDFINNKKGICCMDELLFNVYSDKDLIKNQEYFGIERKEKDRWAFFGNIDSFDKIPSNIIELSRVGDNDLSFYRRTIGIISQQSQRISREFGAYSYSGEDNHMKTRYTRGHVKTFRTLESIELEKIILGVYNLKERARRIDEFVNGLNIDLNESSEDIKKTLIEKLWKNPDYL